MLPQDLFEEILSRLPVKSLLQFRCVCKHWNILISSSRRFACLHLKRSLSNPTMHSIVARQDSFLYKSLPTVYLDPVNLAPLPARTSSHLDPYHPAVNPVDPHKRARIFVGSINGLVCLRSIPEFEPDWIRIWNPSTKTVRELIPITKADYCTVAFGWDPIANDHKVLRLCRSLSGGSAGGWVEVWSVGSSRSWRSIQVDSMNDVLPVYSNNLIMEDGRTYCLVSRGRKNINGDIFRYKDLIACFDMVNVGVKFISIPVDTIDHEGDQVSMVNWKGTIALFTHIEKDEVNTPQSFQVWRLMDEDSESWTKSFVIDLSDGRSVYNPAISISPTRVLILGFGELHLYDLETKECQKSRVFEDAQLQACYHVQSLF